MKNFTFKLSNLKSIIKRYYFILTQRKNILIFKQMINRPKGTVTGNDLRFSLSFKITTKVDYKHVNIKR